MTFLSFKPEFPDGTPRRKGERAAEKLFLQNYSWLLECALNITHGDRERSEDLVHDVFLQFLDKDADLASIADVRGYLNGILRNLHLLQLRRSTRHPMQLLTIVDHDSALVGLRVTNSADLFQCADLLLRACDFVCYRKEAALTASIMILRFFHGYYPGEICLLLKAKRNTVDKWIERGRSETKQYLEAPYPLPASVAVEEKKSVPASANAFLRSLRDRVFASCATPCSVLTDDPEELGVKELAHLVSCRACLDAQGRKVGLGHVAERMADDISNNDDARPKGGSGGNGEISQLRSRRKPSRQAMLREVYARRRERFEHRPKEISLAFDGQLHATLLVTAPMNTLSLSLDNEEVPNSIAVLSEQEFQFLILDRGELMSSERHTHRLPLSDDRVLEVIVTPETLGVSIQVVYEDPRSYALAGNAEHLVAQKAADGYSILSFPVGKPDMPATATTGWWSALLARIWNPSPAMNALLTSAIVLGTIAILCFAFWLRGTPTLSARELLDHAEKSERAAVSADRPGVVYERIAIRTRRRVVERTVYRDAQGVRLPRHQQLAPEDEQLKIELATVGVDWDLPISAVDYAAWRSRMGATQDSVTRSGPHLLTLTTTPLNDNSVVKETLTVRDTDFHAVARMVELRDNSTVEIAELNYDVLPWGAVNQDWFEPLSRKAPGPAVIFHAHPAAHLPSPLTETELNAAELAARVALNQMNADTGEQVLVSRSADGIQVKGVVDTDQRKLQLEDRLLQIPHVQTSLLSVEELGSRPLTDTSDAGEPVQAYSIDVRPSPLEQYLREKKLPLEQLQTISRSLLDQSLKAERAAAHLSELHHRFQEVNQLPVEQQNQLAELSRNYLHAIESGLDTNKRTLISLGLVGSQPTSSPIDLQGEDLDRQFQRYQELCQQLITRGTAEPISAVVTAGQLAGSDAQLRSGAAQLHALVTTAHN